MDQYYMTKALALAKLGEGRVNPNPMVGAIIVKDNKIIGEGYHMAYGQAHAEVNAFKNCNESAEGATLYVTLEPCSHYGKTPPCVELVIREKVSHVVIGSLDPNPLVAGRGIRKLQEAGIAVTVGVLEKECHRLNAVFMKYIVTKMPYVVMKTAMSLDGKIATATGQSKWITGEEARCDVHRLRNKLMGIMVGSRTAILDNPFLTCRIEGGRNPIPIVVDSQLQLSLKSHLVQNAMTNQLIVATTSRAPEAKKEILKKAGVQIIETKAKENHVDLKELMKKLGEQGIDSILLEGGATLNAAALQSGIVDAVKCYISPKIIGGETAKTPVEGKGIYNLEDAIRLENLEVSKLGEDFCMTGEVKKGEV
nr:bifunctional diaminohydroxyphosphoribosylaminopyrimidine deaminase/5-amino-6-(5-phosphoribosylamino)uracil reductase RibD [uncultured Cellulosilyticum sp.]